MQPDTAISFNGPAVTGKVAIEAIGAVTGCVEDSIAAELPAVRLQGGIPAIANLDQYAGVWAISEIAARSLIGMVNNLNVSQHVAENQAGVAAAAQDFGYDVVFGNVAVVELSGTMTKYGSSFSREGSTLRARKAIRAAANDPNITGILLKIDSPGGTIAGTQDLANDVRTAATRKNVVAFCEDQCCSAAFWVASQADNVYAANDTTIVGSIGTLMVVEDWSKYAENKGVKVHLVKTGSMKGAGVPGTAVSEDHLLSWQKTVNELNSSFVGAVQKGRSMTKAEIKALTDATLHTGAEAIEMKLIDGIQSLDKVLATLSRAKPKGTSASVPVHTESVMSQGTTTTDPVAATFDQIVGGCKGINLENGDDARFVADCQKRKLTAEQAKDQWAETLQARISSRDEELQKARVTATARGASPTAPATLADGNKGTDGRADAGDPITAWESLVAENLKACGDNRAQAISRTVQEHPEAHEAYLQAYNAKHPNASDRLKQMRMARRKAG